MKTFREARREIFDDPEATLDEVVEAARQNPAEAHLLIRSPAFVLANFLGQCSNLVERMGEAAILGLLPAFDQLSTRELHETLAMGDLEGGCRIAGSLPEPAGAVAAMAMELGRAPDSLVLARSLGRLVGSGQWSGALWQTAIKSLSKADAKIEIGEGSELIQALKELWEKPREELIQAANKGGLFPEDRAFLALASKDLELLAELSSDHEAAALMLSGSALPDTALCAIALFGHRDLRKLARAQLERRELDPISHLMKPPPMAQEEQATAEEAKVNRKLEIPAERPSWDRRSQLADLL